MLVLDLGMGKIHDEDGLWAGTINNFFFFFFTYFNKRAESIFLIPPLEQNPNGHL